MAKVTYLGSGQIGKNPRTGRVFSLDPHSITLMPGQFSQRYHVIRGVEFTVKNLDDIKYFVDCVKGGAYKVVLGLKERRQLANLLEKLGLTCTATGLVKKVGEE